MVTNPDAPVRVDVDAAERIDAWLDVRDAIGARGRGTRNVTTDGGQE